MRIFLVGLLIVVLSYFTYQFSRPDGELPPAPQAQSVETPQLAQSIHSGSTAQVMVPTPPPAIPKVTAVTHPLFKVPVEPTVFELSTGALVIWRNFAAQKPALVLFSVHPFLEPLPPTERKFIRDFVKNAPATELVRRSRLNAADTALLPPQTVSAAIEAGLLGEFIFVQPTTQPVNKVTLKSFQQRAFASGFLSENEALALTLKDGIISGKVRGIPFRCVHPDALPKINRPVIVHIDLGYFKDLYIDDVKTPMYNLLYKTARSVRDAGWKALDATLSYSNQEAEFSLETRFMISNMSTLLLHPELLEGGTPPSWQMRSNAQLSKAMFDEETAKDLTVKASEIAQDDPDALYALSLQKFIELQPDEAFSLLDKAVELDPGYALAYLDLADTAIETGRWAKAEDFLRKAQRIFPNNPFVSMSLADLLIRQERTEEAVLLLTDLLQLPWSPVYHAGAPEQLRLMLESANEPSASNKITPPVQPPPTRP